MGQEEQRRLDWLGGGWRADPAGKGKKVLKAWRDSEGSFSKEGEGEKAGGGARS